MYSGSRRYRGVRYVTQYVPIDASSGASSNIQSDKEVTITSNGTTTIQPDSGYDAMSQVSVTTNITNLPLVITSIATSSEPEPPAAEIIPLSSFTLATSNTTVNIPLSSTLVYINPNGNFFVKSRANSDTATVSSGEYYYIINGRYGGTVGLVDANNTLISYIMDDRYSDAFPVRSWFNPNYISFDFSS